MPIKDFAEQVLMVPREDYSDHFKEALHKWQCHSVEAITIYIGFGTCGKIAGAELIEATVKEYLKSQKKTAQIIEVGCIGACWAEPLLDIQIPGHPRVCYHHVTPEMVYPILDAGFSATIIKEFVLGQYRHDHTEPWEGIPILEEHKVFEKQYRQLLKYCGIIDPNDIRPYLAQGGYATLARIISTQTPNQVREEILKSKLRGRGGGGFPTGEKWQLAIEAPGNPKYLICNADESDPGAYMDRALIEGNPHQLVEGIALAAYAIGTGKTYIYIRSTYELAIQRLTKAIADCREAGIVGQNILNSGFNLSIDIKKGAGAFVCGEETALINSLEGKRGIPRPKPPYPTQRGLFNKPTVINNVETLSNVPHVLKNGAETYRKTGTKESPGTKLFAISGKLKYPGLVEVPMGTTLRDIIFETAGGIVNDKKFKAAQIGGPSGSCMVSRHLDIPLDFESLHKTGAIMGSGGLLIVDEDTCMVDLSCFFAEFLQKASCGKCIPCREGTHRILQILKSITEKPSNTHHQSLDRFKGVMQLEDIGSVMKETSLCGLGKTAAIPILSALSYFREEFEEHIFERKCRANVCRGLRTYEIDVEACTGCTICATKCPENAIIGTARYPHFIVEDKCTGCGICLEVCKFNAIKMKI